MKSSFDKPLELFDKRKYVKICAPMVRFSKLGFRMLVRKYGCDLACTPMIMADSFVQSKQARDSEFTTNHTDRPLVVQFASNNAKDFADATELVAPFCDAIDLNCGCPQRWALGQGCGAFLIKQPETVVDMIQQARSRTNLPISIKIRICEDIKDTIELCRRVEHAHVSWITVHGRTVKQRAEPVNNEVIKMVKDCLTIPVVANGDIRSLQDAEAVHASTGVDGVMAARGILANPAMYDGHPATPLQCVQDWVDLSLSVGTPFICFHRHLYNMTEEIMSKPGKH
ncbi:tRNA-dihydrouridine(20a/20b) synthase [NAD(P)+]-like isoform X2 [Dysidea avara]|uniref:tRNA-dihydrouridine(20a/20b) synthase [NAD(P)+]-like isoform X2 n=1 Tax=Dysidea avara TaxID=196820 RepID=UPI00331D8027